MSEYAGSDGLSPGAHTGHDIPLELFSLRYQSAKNRNDTVACYYDVEWAFCTFGFRGPERPSKYLLYR
jgi:hypothetical protein